MKKLSSVFSKKYLLPHTSNVSNGTLDKGIRCINYVRHIVILISVCLTVMFTSCTSVPSGTYVNPVDLLDDKSSFYLAIPKAADEDLIDRMISKYIPQLSSKNVEKISSRTKNIYCGINRNRYGSTIQAAIEGNIPTSLVPSLLTKKNGWTERQYINDESGRTHKIYSLDGIDISFPEKNIALVGRDIEGMINKYDYLSTMPLPSLKSDVTAPSENKNTIIQDYLKGAVTDIRFYANKPKSFLAALTGSDLDLKLLDVSGSFRLDSEYENQYLLDIYLNFKQTKFLKAGKALLGLVFGLTSADTKIVDSNQLQVLGIDIQKQQLYKILAI